MEAAEGAVTPKCQFNVGYVCLSHIFLMTVDKPLSNYEEDSVCFSSASQHFP